MNPVFSGQGELIAVLYLGPLLIAALWDMRRFRIPNEVVVILAAAFIPASVLSFGPVNLIEHLSAAAIMFGFGLIMNRLSLLGGGDVKLMTAAALWVGVGSLIPYFILVSILGGFTLLALMACRRLVRLAPVTRLTGANATTMPAILREGERIPYALPIAAASLILLPQLPFLAH